jgi:hypothetical protein
MSENLTRLFSFDAGIYNWQEIVESKQAALPMLEKPLNGNHDYVISPQALSLTSIQSLDHQIREAIKPVISDIEILKPKPFKALSEETQLALAKKLEQAKKPETKESLSNLISLLKDNSDLVTLFQSYTNWLQKA